MRGCMIVYPCGCSSLDGKLHSRCEKHRDEPKEKLKPSPELDEWAKRQKERPHGPR